MIEAKEVYELIETLKWNGDDHLELMNIHISKATDVDSRLRMELAENRATIRLIKLKIKQEMFNTKERLKTEDIEKKWKTAELKEAAEQIMIKTDLFKEQIRLENLNTLLNSAVATVDKIIESLKSSSTNLQSLNKTKFLK